jgi:DNA-binding MarR family transcriptional regulator
MSSRIPKQDQVGELVELFRVNGHQENAFDNLAAGRLGLNRTDLDCISMVQRSGGLTAGELAVESGLTTGAVTGVVDRLERAGYARRVPDPADRRKVVIEVTPEFYERAGGIWRPMAEDWQQTMSDRFTVAELKSFAGFLRAANAIGRRHLDRLRDSE